FVVNEHQSSTDNVTLLFTVADPYSYRDLGCQLMATMAERDRRIIDGYDHLYFFSLRWLNNERLLLMATGHGSRSGHQFAFTLSYEYTVDGNFVRIGYLPEERSTTEVE